MRTGMPQMVFRWIAGAWVIRVGPGIMAVLALCLAGCTAGPYFITAPYGQLDMSSSYRLSNLMGDLPGDPELTFDVQNVTKSKLRTYEQYTYATNTYYDFGTVYLFGFRASF